MIGQDGAFRNGRETSGPARDRVDRMNMMFWRNALIFVICLGGILAVGRAGGEAGSADEREPASGEAHEIELPRHEAGLISDEEMAALDDVDYHLREAVSRVLMRDRQMVLEEVERAYARAATWEQRQRLREVAQHHFVRGIQGKHANPDGAAALGLSQSSVPVGAESGVEHPAIRVMDTFPGFPAYAALQVGDVIVSVNGQTLTQDDAHDPMELAARFGELVRKHKPGTEVELAVMRDGRQVRVKLELASYESLSEVIDPSGAESLKPKYHAMWLDYEAKLRELDPPPVRHLGRVAWRGDVSARPHSAARS